MIFILVCLVTIVALVVGYAWHHSLYWRRRGIPGPPSQIFVGNLIQLGDPVDYPLPFKLAEWTKKYGSTYGIQRGYCNALITSDYEVVRQVFHEQFENFYERDLIPLNGDPDKRPVINVFSARGLRWKRLRKLTSIAFTTKSLKRIFPTIHQTANRMCEILEEDLKTTPVVDILKSFQEYTADVILRSTFGRYEDRPFIHELIKNTVDSFCQLRGWSFKLSWIFPWIGPIIGDHNGWTLLWYKKPVAGFFQEISEDVQNRKRDKYLHNIVDQPTDIIDLLMEAEAEQVVLHDNDKYSRKSVQVENRLTIHEIIETCNGFLRAGFGTTANTLALTVYYLSKNPDIQDKLRAEILECCPDDDLDYDSVFNLKYANAAFQETLRLWPVSGAFISRRCTKTTKVGDIEIEKGTDVVLDVMTLHRDKKVFGADAEEYRPERWLVDNAPHANFLGFGDGLRACIGIRLVNMEQRVALAKLLRRYRFYPVPESEGAMDIFGVIMGPRSTKVKLERI